MTSPNSGDVARALRLAAQASTAIFVFATPRHPPRTFQLADGPPVTYAKQTDDSYVDLLTWTKAFYLSALTRQPHLTAELAGIPYTLLMRSSTRGGDELGYRFVDLLKAVWSQPRFTGHPVFAEYEALCASGPGGSAPNEYVERITAPLVRLLRHLEGGDGPGFGAALAEGVKLHRKHWTSTKRLREDFEGFVSLPLTAVAAVAWDRGMRFDVESGYTPRSWVTGELFATG